MLLTVERDLTFTVLVGVGAFLREEMFSILYILQNLIQVWFHSG